VTALYLCYQSLLEPLTRTQVVAYLEGLSLSGYRLVLLTFEPRRLTRRESRAWRDWLAARGITWVWLRYHKRPTVPATAWDIACGIATGLRLVQRYRIRLLHARGHVPGLIALALQRLSGAKLLFDVRGFMAEEYVDAGIWPANGRLFRMTKRVERALVQAADAIIVLAEQARTLLETWYPHQVNGKRIQVIPCCVDLRANQEADEAKQPRAGAARGKTIAYVGKLGGWYLTEAMVDFMQTAMQMAPELRCQVWTQSDPGPLRACLQARNLNGRIQIGTLAPAELARELASVDAGLSFVKPCLSKRASSPTKIGEYLAAGLPVVSTAGIGDMDDLLLDPAASGPVGVLVEELSPEGYRRAVRGLLHLLDEPDIRRRCRAVAERRLDLSRVGWSRYRQVYDHLLGGQAAS
jgi:glycosyltransferase involved in cell wall biosynthesis